MQYMGVETAASKWNVSERSARYYCSQGRVPGAVLNGKTWSIPQDAKKPERKQRTSDAPVDLLTRLKAEKDMNMPGGIYHKIQIELTYNSNHIEGSRLTHDQTRFIFETSTIGVQKESLRVDDIVETANHFRCIDMIIDHANYALSESFIKQLHLVLKSGTSDSRKAWFAVGDYKRLENEVAGKETVSPKEVKTRIKELLKKYGSIKKKSLSDIIDFHYEFERIHPFQDGNGRVGRLLMFMECLHNGITPFIIEDDFKDFYYRGLNEWKDEPGYLMDTCLAAQDRFKAYLDYFGIEYND